MSYDLKFKKSAFKEWNKLGAAILNQLKKKLKGVLLNPHIPSAKLSGDNSLYKIKLRQAGYRLIYEVNDQKKVIVIVVAIGKREKGNIYKVATERAH